ncbi:TonB-dependent receptor plug domain-containing protein [Leptospira sp. 96542]|nr:TonB-dependent receptor plug domain-containing protein [Leptospira sp. 96542]
MPPCLKTFLSSLFFFCFLPLFAQEPQTLEVTGNQTGKSKNRNFAKNPTGFQKEIELKDTNTRYLSLPDVLEKEAGIRIRQFGGLGSYSTLSLRGTNPNQTKVYWNGIPINNSMGGEVNLADLPFDNLEKIEIYKSGTPSGFSGSAIGGSINLVSKSKLDKPTTRINLMGGSFGTVKTTASRMDGFESGNYFIQALHETSDQNFSYLNNKGTLLLNTYDDIIDERKNAQFKKTGFTGNVNFDLGKTKISFLNDYIHRKQGLPGPGNRQTESVKRVFSKLSSAVTTETNELFFENLSLDTKLFGLYATDDLFDPKSEFSYGTPDSLTKISQYGFNLSPTLYLLDYSQILRLHLQTEQEFFTRFEKRSNHETERKEPKKRRDTQSASIQDEIRFFKERLIFVPQIRWERYVDSFGLDETSIRNQMTDPLGNVFKSKTEFTNPSFGIKIVWMRNEKFEFGSLGNISKDYRIPSFIELFGERGTIIGNTNLKPEQSRNGDFGFYTNTKPNKDWKMNSDVSIFQKRIYDMILFLPNSQFTLRPENVDEAIIKGLETSHNLIWNKGLKLNVNYTYQDAKNISNSPSLNGKFLPLRSKSQGSGLIAFFNSWGEIGFEYQYIGANFRDRTNEYLGYLPARQFYNLYLTFTPYKNTETGNEFLIGLEVRNLTDKRVEDLVGYPLPGRNYYLTGSYKF